MDDKEHKQIDLIIQGRVKNKSRVEQRTYRYAQPREPATLELLEGITRLLDPEGRVNPGSLGLG